MVTQNVAHGRGGEGAEVCTAFDIDPGLSDQFHVRFVNQRCRVQRMVATPAPALSLCYVPQLFVKDAEKRVESVIVACVQPIQQRDDRFLSLTRTGSAHGRDRMPGASACGHFSPSRPSHGLTRAWGRMSLHRHAAPACGPLNRGSRTDSRPAPG
jgi:hypothetical protein